MCCFLIQFSPISLVKISIKINCHPTNVLFKDMLFGVAPRPAVTFTFIVNILTWIYANHMQTKWSFFIHTRLHWLHRNFKSPFFHGQLSTNENFKRLNNICLKRGQVMNWLSTWHLQNARNTRTKLHSNWWAFLFGVKYNNWFIFVHLSSPR